MMFDLLKEAHILLLNELPTNQVHRYIMSYEIEARH